MPIPPVKMTLSCAHPTRTRTAGRSTRQVDVVAAGARLGVGELGVAGGAYQEQHAAATDTPSAAGVLATLEKTSGAVSEDARTDHDADG